MDQLRDMGITDDLADSVNGGKNNAGWAEYYKDRMSSVPVRKVGLSERKTQNAMPMTDDERIGWGALIVIVLILLEMAF